MGVVAGVAAPGGVALAADRMVIVDGVVRARNRCKLHEINGLGVAVEGPVGDADRILRYLQAEAKRYRMERGRPMSVVAAARVATEHIRSEELDARVILAGVQDDRPVIRGVAPGGVLEDPVLAWGSGAPYALGTLESADAGADAVNRLRSAVEAARERDPDTGGEIDTWKWEAG